MGLLTGSLGILAEAHEQVSRLEEALLDEMPDMHRVQAHIEPQSVPVETAVGQGQDRERLEAQIVALVGEIEGLHGCRDVLIHVEPEGAG